MDFPDCCKGELQSMALIGFPTHQSAMAGSRTLQYEAWPLKTECPK